MEELFNILAFGNFSNRDIETAILLEILNGEENRNVRERYGEFRFEDLTEQESYELFRFGKNEILRLVELLKLNNTDLKTPEQIRVTGLEAMCILLRRLAYPNRFLELEQLFGRSRTALSSICNTLIRKLVPHVQPYLQDLRNIPWLTRQRLQLYAQVIANKDLTFKKCWGFLDGTARNICRPTRGQREHFSGHKRSHCLKYQSVMCPDGIIMHLGGPWPGRRHDAGILRESQFYNQLEEVALNGNEKFVLYADQGYPLRELIITPYHTARTPEQIAFNKRMSSVRECVEWGFGKIVNEFAFLDFKKNQKLLKQLVADMYLVAVFLTNCHTCIYSSQTSEYFDLPPPSVEEYINGMFNR